MKIAYNITTTDGMRGVPSTTHRNYVVQHNISGMISWTSLALLILLAIPLATALTILSPQEGTYNHTTVQVSYQTASQSCHAVSESVTGTRPLTIPDVAACHDFSYDTTPGKNSLIIDDGTETQSVSFTIGNETEENGTPSLVNISNATPDASNLNPNITVTDGGVSGAAAQSLSPAGGIDAKTPFSLPNEPGRLRFMTGDGKLVNAHLTWRRDDAVVSDADITAFDPTSLPAGTYDVELTVPGRSLKRLHLNSLRYDPMLAAGVEELDPTQITGNLPLFALDSFAVDPSSLSFSSGSITFIAEGNALYKCAAYDFASRTCNGPNLKLLDTIPGREYTVALTPDDPLYTQTNYLTNALFAANNLGWTFVSEQNTVTNTSAADGDPANRCAQMQGQTNIVSIGDYTQVFNLTLPNGTSLVQVNFTAYYRISTYANPGSLNFWIQNASQTTTYCSFNRSFAAAVAWSQVTFETGDNCSLSSFSPNTNYTVRLRCTLNSSAATREVCRWDTINVTTTYQDTYTKFNTHSIAPSPAYRNATLNCSVNVTDNESSQIPVNFTWWKNSVQNMSMNGTAICTNASLCYDSMAVGSGNLTPGDVWTCNATAYPGSLKLQSNSSANITIQNRAPSINLSTPASTINLVAGSSVLIQCNASVTDQDNASTILSTAASLYLNGTSPAASDSNRTHYTNASCTAIGNNSVTKNFTCNFTVYYYASNGSWLCNVTVNDTWNLTSNTTPLIIGQLLAVNITPWTISFGTVAIGNISQNQSVNVTNIGNLAMNISVWAYGQAYGDNYSFWCGTGGLNTSYLQFSTDISANYTQKQPVGTTTDTTFLNLTVQPQTNSTPSLNASYWQLSVPQLANLAGLCNGTLVFEASGA